MNLSCLIGKHKLVKLEDNRTIETGFTPDVVIIKGPSSTDRFYMPDLPDWAKNLYSCVKCGQVFYCD